MTQYKVVTAYTESGMENAVNKLLAAGWRPCGGIAMTEGLYAQAMTKTEVPMTDDQTLWESLKRSAK